MTGSYPASSQLLVFKHLALPGVLHLDCDKICVSGMLFRPVSYMSLHAYMRWNPICRCLAVLAIISQAPVTVAPFFFFSSWLCEGFSWHLCAFVCCLKEMCIFIYSVFQALLKKNPLYCHWCSFYIRDSCFPALRLNHSATMQHWQPVEVCCSGQCWRF